VQGTVKNALSCPVIVRYEVELAPGMRTNQVANLSDDLAMRLSAKSIRILAPVPGKNAIGVEVPQKKPHVVYLKDVLRSPVFNPGEDSIVLAIGKDVVGQEVVTDLVKAPHMLVAGQTGSGKSVCINSFLSSILFSKTPDEVRLILVDPKLVEFKPYEKIPHLLTPIISDPKKALQALKWATFEMDRRLKVLAGAGVRDIQGFNRKFRENMIGEGVAEADRHRMPYIVIIIDELADLMQMDNTLRKEVETNINRIAQKARAAGIHLIIATQRPSVNVITGTIKANLPTRIAFKVVSAIDAKTIMQTTGAERLLGRGDMLFQGGGEPEPERLHGAFVSNEETLDIAAACASQPGNYPQMQCLEVKTEDEEEEGDAEFRLDEKFSEAAELVIGIKQASASLLQRRMSVGYAKAGRLIDQLERLGVIGPDPGNSKPREVRWTMEELDEYLTPAKT
ncbi:MAG: DNA translocase FtsK, partial [Gemmatimonadales bacterium]